MPVVFVYGALAEGDEAAWLGDLPRTPATARGALWNDARRRGVLVPNPLGDRIPGLLVDVGEARLALLTVLLGGSPTGTPTAPGDPEWLPISASAGLRPVPALTWGVPDARRARVGRLRAPRGGG